MSPDLEVIWNGAVDRQWAIGQQQPAPSLAESPPVFDVGTVGDRVTHYVQSLGLDEDITTATVARCCDITRNCAATWLRRAMERGELVLCNPGLHGTRLPVIYRRASEEDVWT